MNTLARWWKRLWCRHELEVLSGVVACRKCDY
jgi:hypothetical protein